MTCRWSILGGVDLVEPYDLGLGHLVMHWRGEGSEQDATLGTSGASSVSKWVSEAEPISGRRSRWRCLTGGGLQFGYELSLLSAWGSASHFSASKALGTHN